MTDNLKLIEEWDRRPDVAADDIAGVKFLRHKLTLGADGQNDGDVSKTNPVPILEASVLALAGGQSQALAISGTSAQSAAITTSFAKITPTVDCFFRAAANPTALADGTDDFLLGGVSYRIIGITSGHKLAFKTSGATGTVYITPGA